MPGNCDSDDSMSSSPSLISGLRTFRFQRNQCNQLSTHTSSENARFPGASSSSCSTPDSPEVTVIPETPESLVDQVANGSEGFSREGSSSPGPCFTRKIMGNHRAKVKSCDTASSIQDEREAAMDDYTVFCEKEQCLKELVKHVPHLDIMEAQDYLVSSAWDLPSAITLARSKPPSSAKKKAGQSSVSSTKGIIYKDSFSDNLRSLTSGNIINSDSENSVEVTSTVNGTSSFQTNGLSSNLSGAEIYGNKRRRIIQLDSDDDDDDVIIEENNESNQDTVNNYVPSSDGLLLQQSHDKRPHIQSLTYSKLNSHSTTPRVVQSSVFTDEPRPLIISKVRRRTPASPSKSKIVKKKRKRIDWDVDDDCGEDYGNELVYDSEDSDAGEGLTPARSAVLTFFREATTDELATIPGCSKKKIEVLVKYRPYKSWDDLVQKLNEDKGLSTELLNGAKKVLDMRTAVTRLMNKCKRIALQMEDLVEALKENKEDSKDYVSKQPELLSTELNLTPYQMLGLNWLLLMHNQEVNGILADEMGLGKTIQALAFLAYLKEQDVPGPHLIVVPSSTLHNWQNELKAWWPSSSVLCYHGTQESRRELRLDIINDEIEEFDIIVTTYNMVTSSAEDRSFFKKMKFYYVIFDEAHMLKNMSSQRYQHLMKLNANRRLLLTGTPLQNNLLELMSLLIFAMPDMFSGKTEQVKQMFTCVAKSEEGRSRFERDQIEHAKKIMKPFVLRRLKSEVLKDLPTKHEEIRFCAMTPEQSMQYTNLVAVLSEEVKEKEINTSGAGMMMQLRKAANHPLLLRNHYNDKLLVKMSKLMLKEPTHTESNCDLVFEDMSVMSDFELHKLCQRYKILRSHALEDETILASGKFCLLDQLLPKMIAQGHRILLFSQFTMVLDIIQEYMSIKKYRILRLDGSVPVTERQMLIDEFTADPDIPIFLLSTRAGGLGINLTTADTVLIHDIDFNPYNDKQAEDRSHRVGQTRDVTVIRMISEDTIEEGMLQRANEKLKLEQDLTSSSNDEEKDKACVAKLLRDALGLSAAKS